MGSYTGAFVVAGSPECGDYKLSQRSVNVGATLRSRSPECGDYKLVSQSSFNVGSYTGAFVVAGSPECGDYKQAINVGAKRG